MRTPASRRGVLQSRSSAARNAASVLPDPVGATISVFRPAAIAGQPSRCEGVGSPNASRNQAATGGRNRASTSSSASPSSSESIRYRNPSPYNPHFPDRVATPLIVSQKATGGKRELVRAFRIWKGTRGHVRKRSSEAWTSTTRTAARTWKFVRILPRELGVEARKRGAGG